MGSIGADASRYLVRGLAKAGHGNSEFVVSGERVEAKVLLQLKRALQPVYKHVRLDWGHLNVKSSSPKVFKLYMCIEELEYPSLV